MLEEKAKQNKGKQTDVKTLTQIFVTLIFWSSAFAGIRFAIQDYSPGHLALLRFLLASGVLVIYSVINHVQFPNKRDIPKIMLLGFAGVTVYHIALNYGEITVTAGAASLIIAITPELTALLAIIFLKEKMNKWGWIGIATSFFGVFLVTLGEGQGLQFDFGAILVLIAAISTSAYFVFQKPLLQKYDAISLTTYVICAGTFFMLIFLPGLPQAIVSAPLPSTLTVAYLGIFPGALAYVTWTQALSKAPASLVSSFLYLSPVLAIFIAWVLLNEIPSLVSLVGGSFSILGVIIVGLFYQ
ncbi:MAG: DMT family transporter [Candidatus Bathyarchaeota archaeon]|nr:DMT family transporter [Candidatus Bathyarchaeota archaeon]